MRKSKSRQITTKRHKLTFEHPNNQELKCLLSGYNLFQKAQSAWLTHHSVHNLAKKKLAWSSLEPPVLPSSKVPVQQFFYKGLGFRSAWTIPIQYKLCYKILEITVSLCYCAQLPHFILTLSLINWVSCKTLWGKVIRIPPFPHKDTCSGIFHE